MVERKSYFVSFLIIHGRIQWTQGQWEVLSMGQLMIQKRFGFYFQQQGRAGSSEDGGRRQGRDSQCSAVEGARWVHTASGQKV